MKYFVLLLLDVIQYNENNRNTIGLRLGLAWLAFTTGFSNMPLWNTDFLFPAWLVGYGMAGWVCNVVSEWR